MLLGFIDRKISFQLSIKILISTSKEFLSKNVLLPQSVFFLFIYNRFGNVHNVGNSFFPINKS